MKYVLFFLFLICSLQIQAHDNLAVLPENLNIVDSVLCSSARRIASDHKICDLIGDKSAILVSSNVGFVYGDSRHAGHLFNLLIYNGHGALTCVELERDTTSRDYNVVALNSYSSEIALQTYQDLSILDSQYGSSYYGNKDDLRRLYEMYIYSAVIRDNNVYREQCLPLLFKPFCLLNEEEMKIISHGVNFVPFLSNMNIMVINKICDQMQKLKYGNKQLHHIIKKTFIPSRNCNPTVLPPSLALRLKVY